MIIGIGTDIVDIKRFDAWIKFSTRQLQRVFHPEEIAYSLSIPSCAAQRLAVRFAAKEAFFKAIYPHLLVPKATLLSVARFIIVQKSNDGSLGMHIEWDQMPINWQHLSRESIAVYVSLSHAHELALATIVIESV